MIKLKTNTWHVLRCLPALLLALAIGSCSAGPQTTAVPPSPEPTFTQPLQPRPSSTPQPGPLPTSTLTATVAASATFTLEAPPTVQPSPDNANRPSLPGTLSLERRHAKGGFELWDFTYTEPGWDTQMTGIIHKPQGEGPFPAVVISHGKGGAAIGFSLLKAQEWFPEYVSIAPNYTHAGKRLGGEGPEGGSPENVRRAMRSLDILESQDLADLIGPVVDRSQLYLYGNSMGGDVTIEASAQAGSRIKRAAYTASGLDPQRTPSGAAAAETVEAPFLMLHGEYDGTVPPAASQAWAEALEEAGKAYQLVWFPNGEHNLHEDELTAAIAREFVRAWFSQPSPEIAEISRQGASSADALVLHGAHFGENLNEDGLVLFNGQAGQILEWSDALLEVVPPPGASGRVRVIVPVGPTRDPQVAQPVTGGLQSNAVPFSTQGSSEAPGG